MQLYFVNTINVNMKHMLYEYHLLFSKYYSGFLMYIFTKLSHSGNSGDTVPEIIIFHNNHLSM